MSAGAPATASERGSELSEALTSREGVELRHLCDLAVDLDLRTVDSPAGRQMIFTITGGWARGERLSGQFVPGGGDWVLLGADGIAHLDVRATLETDDGELVYLTNRGRVVTDENVIGRLAAGERVDADAFYARSSPLFETGSERYAWLNGIVTVAANELALNRVGYRIFEVL